jgi:hypothetical protein
MRPSPRLIACAANALPALLNAPISSGVVELRTRGDQRAADTLNAAITARENFHRWSAS